MSLFDMRTIIFSNVVTDIVCLLVILLLWHQSRKRFAGTGFWVSDFVFQTAAMFLIIMRGSIPDWMSMVLSNTLVVGGAILGYMALGRFVGKKISQVHNYVLLAAFACVHTYFSSVQPNLAARTLNLSAGLLIICFQCMWLLVYGVERGMRRLTLGVGIVFGGYCLVSVVRIVGFFSGTPAADKFFHSGDFESFILISYQILFILLTYSLILMVNKRLLVDVKTQEEKFSKAFRSSPYAITLTRLSDGQIVEVNDGFLDIAGYEYAEVFEKTTLDLHLWDKEEDRIVVANELSKTGKVQGREFQFRKKSGERITGLFSADIITVNNQKFVLSSISDITERKRTEEALRQRTLELQHLTETLEQRVKERTAELANLSSQLVSAQENERRRVSYNLHDNVWQMLLAIRFEIENLFSSQENWEALRNKSKQVMTDVLDLVGKIRSMQGDLWPYVLDDIGLAATIDWYCREFGKDHSGLVIEMKNEVADREIPSSAKIVIYRILQETLSNVAKHSQASRVTLRLMKRNQEMEFTVEDNGIGFDPEETISRRTPWGRLGLLNIKARTELSRGSFGIESSKGKGTIVRASWLL
jgi:PAS domain S-box-containing protein